MTVAELGFKVGSQPITQASRELDRLTQSARQTEKEVTRLGATASSALGFLKGFAGSFISAFASTQTLRIIRDVADQVSKIGENARLIGVTAQQLQVLRYAILQSGGAAMDADKGMTEFVKKLGEAATGQGYLFRLLQANNVQFKDRSALEVWTDFLDILKRAPDEAARMRMATRVLGNELGPTFAKLAVQGPEALSKAYEDLQKSGAILTDEQISNAQKIDEEWKKLEYTIGQRVKGAIINVTSVTASLLTDTEKKLNDIGNSDFFKKLADWHTRMGFVDPLVPGANDLLAQARGKGKGTQPRPQIIITPGPRNQGRPSRDPGTRDLTNEYTRLTKSLEKQIVTLEAEAATYGQGEAAIERYRVQQQLLLAAEQAKMKMTPALRKEIERLADAYGNAADAAARTRLRTDLAFERDQLGRSETEANVGARLRSAGLPVDLQSTEANLIRINEQIRMGKEIGTEFALDFGRTLREELRNGASAWDAFQKAGLRALTRLSDKLMDMAIQDLAAKAFGGSGLNIFSLFGSSGATGAAATGVGAYPYHVGGRAGDGIASRFIHPAYFENAPRYHNGILGVDEVPAVLKRGEIVSKDSAQLLQHAALIGGGRGGTSVQVINNTGQKTREDRSIGPDGREMVRIIVGEEMAAGGFDTVQRQKFGNKPRGVQR